MHMHLHILNFYRATSVKLYYVIIQTQIISNTVTGDAVKHSNKKPAVDHEDSTSYGRLFYFLTQNTSSATIVKNKVQVSNYNQCIHAIILYMHKMQRQKKLYIFA